ncbi:hypothetical protein [Methylogaea oryzae]
MELSGGEILIQCLKDEGVEFIFGYPADRCCIFTTPCSSRTT